MTQPRNMGKLIHYDPLMVVCRNTIKQLYTIPCVYSLGHKISYESLKSMA